MRGVGLGLIVLGLGAGGAWWLGPHVAVEPVGVLDPRLPVTVTFVVHNTGRWALEATTVRCGVRLERVRGPGAVESLEPMVTMGTLKPEARELVVCRAGAGDPEPPEGNPVISATASLMVEYHWAGWPARVRTAFRFATRPRADVTLQWLQVSTATRRDTGRGGPGGRSTLIRGGSVA